MNDRSSPQLHLAARLRALLERPSADDGDALERLVDDALAADVPRVAAAAGIALGYALVSWGRYAEADGALARAKDAVSRSGEAPVLRARLATARVVVDDALCEPARAGADEARLSAAAATLERAGCWEDALVAASRLADWAEERRDAEATRHWLARAVGAATAAGYQLRGPGLLRRLASVEVTACRPEEAERLLEVALRQLAPVALSAARLEEARCTEVFGDACRAAGRIPDAMAHYDAAAAQLSQLGAGGSARVREKRAALDD